MFRSEYFNFINATDGLQSGNIHLLFGGIGGGKSTLARSVLFDLARSYKTFLFSTEETIEDLRNHTRGFSEKNLTVFHEDILTKEQDDPKFIAELPERLIAEYIKSKSSIFFFDNLTTSHFYVANDGKPDNQAVFFNRLAMATREIKFPMFIVAHTKSGTRPGAMIEADMIRGSKIPAIKAPYVYAYQRVQHESRDGAPVLVSLVRILKARGTGANGRTFAFKYNHDLKLFENDREIPIEIFKDFIGDAVTW